MPFFFLHCDTLIELSSLQFPETVFISQTTLQCLCMRVPVALYIIEPSRWDCKNNRSGSEQRSWSIYPSISTHLCLRQWLCMWVQYYPIPAENIITSF